MLYGRVDYKVPDDDAAIFTEDFEGLTLGARVDVPKSVEEVTVPLGSIAIREYHDIYGSSISALKNSGKLVSTNPNFPAAIPSGMPDVTAEAAQLEWPPAPDQSDPASRPSSN